MPVPTYEPLFANKTLTELKADVFNRINEFCWKHIQVNSSHIIVSQEMQDIMTLVLKYPLLNYSNNRYYKLIENTEELAEVFCYLDNNLNFHALVKQLGWVAGGGNIELCLFKESGLLCPQSNSIDTQDWTQIKDTAPAAAIDGVTRNSGTLLQTISMGITEISATNTSA